MRLRQGRRIISVGVGVALGVLVLGGQQGMAHPITSPPSAGQRTVVAVDGTGAQGHPSQPVSRLLIKYAQGVVAPMEEGAKIPGGSDVDAELTSGPALGLGWSTADFAIPLDPEEAERIGLQLAESPAIDVVQPDTRLHPTDDARWPNDPLYPRQWGLASYGDANFRDQTDREIGPRTTGINWREATAVTPSQIPIVAVLDTGSTSHPELDGRVIPGYDFISDAPTANDGDGRDPNAADPGNWITPQESTEPPFNLWGCGPRASNWHGTHVMGTLAAEVNNSIGVAGVAGGAHVQPVRVLGKCGGSAGDVAAAIVWAAGGTVPGVPDNPTPAKVINLSLGGAALQCPFVMEDAIDFASERGAAVVVAAGNANSDVSHYAPANCAGAITVAAHDEWGARAQFSNFGQHVDLAAPGVDIVSTVNTGTTGPAGPGYATYSGTSMATPHVSGAAALLIATQPSLSAAGVQQYLKDSASPFKASGAEGRVPGDFTPGAPATDCVGDDSCGSGYLNVAAVLQQVTAPAPPTSARHTIGTDPASPSASVIETVVAPPRVPVDSYIVTVTEGGAVVRSYSTTSVKSQASVALFDRDSDAVRIGVRAVRNGIAGVETSSMRLRSLTKAPPARPTITGVQPGNRSLRVSMRSGYSEPEVSFMVARVQPGGSSCRFLPLTTLGSCTISGLINGQQYTVTLEAYETDMETYSLPALATPLASAPPNFSGPPTVMVQGAQLHVSWQPAVGSHPIETYVVRTAPTTRTSCVVDASAGPLSCTLVNVPTQTPYAVYVQAIDEEGQIGYSDSSTEFTLDAAPIPPSAPTSAPGVHAGGGQAAVSLEPDDLPWYWGGAPDITRGVRIVASPGGQSCDVVVRYDVAMWCGIDGLAVGQSHTFRAYAFTSAGMSVASDPSLPIVATDPSEEPFVPMPPVRVADTRIGEPVAFPVEKHPLSAGSVLEVPIAGRLGVPGSAKAVALNVTAVQPRGAGHLRVYPCGTPRPNSSTVNFVTGTNVANSTYVRVGTDGKVCVYSATATDVVVDLNGWFPASANYEPAVPVRMADTRPGQPVPLPAVKQKVQAGSTLEVPLLGQFGIPSPSAMAVLNVTAVNPEGPGHLRVFPCDAQRPNASTVNFRPGAAAPNQAVVNVRGKGTACIYAGTTTDVLVDLSGWFPADSRVDGGAPMRLLDTRADHPEAPPAVKVPLRAGQTTAVNVKRAPRGPIDARAVVLNVTAVNSRSAGHLRVYPCDQPLPNASTVNFPAGTTVANSATVAASPEGSVCIYSSAATDLIVDLNAWYPYAH